MEQGHAACIVMLRAHALGEFLEYPQFRSATLSALVEYCKLRSPTYVCIIDTFYENNASELVRQLFVDAHYLHATKGTELAEIFTSQYGAQEEAKAWGAFHNRVMWKMTQALQPKVIKELDPKDYKVVDICEEEQA